jgi:transposase InsO family protein
VFVNHTAIINAQVDSGCDCYGAISERAAARLELPTTRLSSPRRLSTAVGTRENTRITHFVRCALDIDGWSAPAALYVIPGLPQDVLLGRPWMKRHGVVLDPQRAELRIRNANNMKVREQQMRSPMELVRAVRGSTYARYARDKQRHPSSQYQFIGTSIHEISLTLEDQRRETNPDPTDILPPELQYRADLFNKDLANGLPPHRGRDDHHIRLKKTPNGGTPELPWGPLYNMPRDQLIELRKQITDLMDKGWIRASSSPAAAPVLLVKKPDGTWRFCVDYRALNKITEQDRYPLPLIKETLRSLSKAKWFTKLDVRSAFHRIRVAEGDEPLTAFRTRFGLFEWLVCPFGLAGAPATFQRYINKTLGTTLGDFVTAYLDDILVYTSGSRRDHMARVQMVLDRLWKAGLHIDLKKCAFATKEVKYLGYIVTAGEQVRPDPEKLAAIRNWVAPTKVKGVRSFLGFANFYRDFIPKFSQLTLPLTRLTKKSTTFYWGKEEQEAFEALRDAFISSPALAQWDPDKDTVVEADCSGWALGGCLSQRDAQGILHPVAYHSARLLPAERNYTIHDKELLAIISCLRAWSAELRSVASPFTIFTDHKNLEYFTTPRLLTERQARWAETLALFNYNLIYRPGTQAARPDALSRREQDEGSIEPRYGQVLRPIQISSLQPRADPAPQPKSTRPGEGPFRDARLNELWKEGIERDKPYEFRLKAIKENARRFPPEARCNQQVADCSINAHGRLMFRERLWLPCWEPLTTTVIQIAHDSPLGGHPGKNTLFNILKRDYHWEGMSQDIRRFTHNCNQCWGGHNSRRRRQGLLRPLPIPDRFWQQISIDFMTNLPAENSQAPRFLMVITDRLSKYVQLEAMTSMTAEACATRFRDVWWRFRGFPSQIISDRGSDWVGQFWSTLCKEVGVEQLLSTAHHPQTDGSTERTNQEVQAVLRVMVSFAQYDWPTHLPACQLALNNRDSSTTGHSPNLILLGYNVDLLERVPTPTNTNTSPQSRALQFLDRLREGADLAQASIAYIQQRQMEATNVSRRPAERFQVGDYVWLSLRNIKTNRPSKKLDWVQAKYKVVAVPSPLTVTLDVPRGLHPTFHVDLVERAASDPLPSQRITDDRPGPQWILDEEDNSLREEYGVEAILSAKNARGRGNKRQVLVKWIGYDNPTWEPLSQLEGTRALDDFEAKYGSVLLNDGPRPSRQTNRSIQEHNESPRKKTTTQTETAAPPNRTPHS